MDRLPMPASMPAELAEKLSDQWDCEPEEQTPSQLDCLIEHGIRREWSMGEFLSPLDEYSLWNAKFRKALGEAVLYEDQIRYAELGKLVHMIARESVREE